VCAIGGPAYLLAP
jgi:hypothetical protein